MDEHVVAPFRSFAGEFEVDPGSWALTDLVGNLTWFAKWLISAGDRADFGRRPANLVSEECPSG